MATLKAMFAALTKIAIGHTVLQADILSALKDDGMIHANGSPTEHGKEWLFQVSAELGRVAARTQVRKAEADRAADEASVRVAHSARKVAINGCEVYALSSEVLTELVKTTGSHVVFDVSNEPGASHEVAIPTVRLRAVAKALRTRGPVFCFVKPGTEYRGATLGFRWNGFNGALNFLSDPEYRAHPGKFSPLRVVIAAPAAKRDALATVYPIRAEVIDAEFDDDASNDVDAMIQLQAAPAPFGLLPAAPEQEVLWFGPEDMHAEFEPVRVRAVRAVRAVRKAPKPRKVAPVAKPAPKPAKRTSVRVVLSVDDSRPPRQHCAGCR